MDRRCTHSHALLEWGSWTVEDGGDDDGGGGDVLVVGNDVDCPMRQRLLTNLPSVAAGPVVVAVAAADAIECTFQVEL